MTYHVIGEGMAAQLISNLVTYWLDIDSTPQESIGWVREGSDGNQGTITVSDVIAAVPDARDYVIAHTEALLKLAVLERHEHGWPVEPAANLMVELEEARTA